MAREPDWDSIKAFAAVARTGTVRGAARLLQVHHATVSRRVDALETQLGCKLFERRPDGLALTGAGETLLGASELARDALNAATRAIAGQDAALSGELTVTLAEPVAEQVLGPRLAGFQARYPGVELRLLITESFLDVARREADVAIRADNNPPGSLVGKRLFAYYQGGYASPEYLARVAAHPHEARWLGWDDGTPRQPDWTAGTAFAAAPVWGQYPQLNMQRIAARNGLGLAMLPCLLGDADPGLRRLPGFEPLRSRDIWLLTHADLRNTARVRAFMGFAEAALRECRGLIEGRAQPAR